jgi:ABC-type antimicrobial peptide transport system permease subunit
VRAGPGPNRLRQLGAFRPRTSRLRGTLIVGWQGLRARRLRALLTCLSLILAVVAIVAIDAIGQAVEAAVAAQTRLTAGMPATWALVLEPGPRAVEQAEALGAATQATLPDGGATAVILSGESVVANGQPISAIGVSGRLRSIRPFLLLAGRWIVNGDGSAIHPEVAVNRAAAGRLGGVGTSQALTVGGSPPLSAHVVGVVNDGLSEPTLYLSTADLLAADDQAAVTGTVQVLASSPATVANAASERLLQAQARLDASSDGGPRRLDGDESYRDALAAVRLAFLLVAGVALVIGCLGLLNIGLATLGERIEEFALRRATGATRGQIFLIVLTEAVLTSLVAALIAVLIAGFGVPALILAFFSSTPGLTVPAFPFGAAALGIAAAAAAGFIGGLVPAVKASRVQIATVMRA